MRGGGLTCFRYGTGVGITYCNLDLDWAKVPLLLLAETVRRLFTRILLISHSNCVSEKLHQTPNPTLFPVIVASVVIGASGFPDEMAWKEASEGAVRGLIYSAVGICTQSAALEDWAGQSRAVRHDYGLTALLGQDSWALYALCWFSVRLVTLSE